MFHYTNEIFGTDLIIQYRVLKIYFGNMIN
jgi:hypothetical protein